MDRPHSVPLPGGGVGPVANTGSGNARLDRIFISNLVTRQIIGVEHWERQKPQNVRISISVLVDTFEASQTDSLLDSCDYGRMAKDTLAFAEKSSFKTVEALASGICQLLICNHKAQEVTVHLEKCSALLYAQGAGVELTRTPQDFCPKNHVDFTSVSDIRPYAKPLDVVFIRELLVRCIIGLNPHERLEKQSVVINLRMSCDDLDRSASSDTIRGTIDYFRIGKRLVSYVEDESSFKTVESLAYNIARVCCIEFGVQRVWVRVGKPSALLFADQAGIEITRHITDFPSAP
eukprot:Clim_evm26s231 gene=Clim_evmTU26s231